MLIFVKNLHRSIVAMQREKRIFLPINCEACGKNITTRDETFASTLSAVFFDDKILNRVAALARGTAGLMWPAKMGWCLLKE